MLFILLLSHFLYCYCINGATSEPTITFKLINMETVSCCLYIYGTVLCPLYYKYGSCYCITLIILVYILLAYDTILSWYNPYLTVILSVLTSMLLMSLVIDYLLLCIMSLSFHIGLYTLLLVSILLFYFMFMFCLMHCVNDCYNVYYNSY